MAQRPQRDCGQMLGQFGFGQPTGEKEPAVIRDYFYFCPPGLKEFSDPLLQTGKLFFNSPRQLCALIMAIGVERTELSPGAPGWDPRFVQIQKGYPKFCHKLLESCMNKCLAACFAPSVEILSLPAGRPVFRPAASRQVLRLR